MKGHPGTAKSTLARFIASSLKIPLLDKDDIPDSSFTLQNSLLLTSPATPSSLLNDLSYHAIWQLASTQLRLRLSVVIDSPLSRKTHLDRLLGIAASVGGRIVIIECKPKDEAEWRRRLERRGGEVSLSPGGPGWHKPTTWQDIERLLKGYGGCTEYDVGDVPKMVVDTTAPVELGELCSGVLELIVAHGGAALSYHQTSKEI
ncbi:hypothetical protein L6164_029289 [Bauhinia variegata]|uniref:Uncharacterized protein n=1 Tax=Bauhinia variegata TaxID=167791 RepID=A0ACB9L885_BAUVA|nr:hypothetical protein L6164_029289 [Bauhinia variegata]